MYLLQLNYHYCISNYSDQLFSYSDLSNIYGLCECTYLFGCCRKLVNTSAASIAAIPASTYVAANRARSIAMQIIKVKFYELSFNHAHPAEKKERKKR